MKSPYFPEPLFRGLRMQMGAPIYIHQGQAIQQSHCLLILLCFHELKVTLVVRKINLQGKERNNSFFTYTLRATNNKYHLEVTVGKWNSQEFQKWVFLDLSLLSASYVFVTLAMVINLPSVLPFICNNLKGSFQHDLKNKKEMQIWFSKPF